MNLKKILPVLLLISIMIGTNLIYSATPVPSGRLTGTWLYLWWHGAASVKNPDGTTITKLMFIPESFRETTAQRNETFLRFRADGTGTFFRRYLVFGLNNKKITVVAKDRNSEWIKADQLDFQTGFHWEIKNEHLIIRTNGITPLNINGRYRFTFNSTPTRPAPRANTSRLQLTEELIIEQLGQFLKVSPDPERDLLRRYGIE